MRIVIEIIIGIVCGSWFANFYYGDNICKLGVLDFEILGQLQQVEVSFENLLEYIIIARIKIWICIIIISCTFLNAAINYLFPIFQGIIMGITGAYMASLYDRSGILFYIVLCVIPQFMYTYSVLVGVKGTNSLTKGYKIRKNISYIVISLLIYVIAMVLEAVICANFQTFLIYY